MAAKSIVILEGGMGGPVAANEYGHLVHPEQRITLIAMAEACICISCPSCGYAFCAI